MTTLVDYSNCEVHVLADDLFDARALLDQLEDDVCAAACALLGVSEEDFEKGLWPFEDLTYDAHDRSFELDDCGVELRLTPEFLDYFWSRGFERVWLNHVDGYETSYLVGGPVGGTRSFRGVS
jgi:hypothetical protein